MKKKRIKLKLYISLGVIISLFCASLIYLCTYYKAKDVSIYLKSDNFVNVSEEKEYIYFDGEGTKDAFIFYPGAKVDEKAYSPLMYNLAKNGIDCYLVKMPLHFAIFGMNKADDIIKNSSYENYYMGGHSLGGAIASTYISKSSYEIDGLVLLASYSSTSLKDKENLKVLSLYGDKDGVLNKANYDKYKKNLYQYEEYVISGGNHAYFGSYGEQNKDNSASITFEEQLDITFTKIKEFILN